MNSQFMEQLQANPLATVSDYYANRLAGNPKAIDYRWSQLRRKKALAEYF